MSEGENMVESQRYDVVYHANHTTIEPHFCRELDESGGCYGTNPDHGYSFEEACAEVANWYAQQAEMWRSGEHHECLSLRSILSQPNEGEGK